MFFLQATNEALAMVQRLAEKYVGELAEMAKNSNMMIVPDRPNDLSAVVATAMGLHSQLANKASDGLPTSAAAIEKAAAPFVGRDAGGGDWAAKK